MGRLRIFRCVGCLLRSCVGHYATILRMHSGQAPQTINATISNLSDLSLTATLFFAMIFFHLLRTNRLKNPTILVGVVISMIVLALGAFLYMRTEGENVGSLQSPESKNSTSSSQIIEAQVQGEPMVVSDGQGNKPFIMAIVPGDAQMEEGAYQLGSGTKLRVLVRAINVENGTLYFKPSSSKELTVQENEQISDLTPSDLPGEYIAVIDVKKDMAGLLIAVMKGKDGQEVQLSVNVSDSK